MCEIACREDVGQGSARQPAGPPALGQVDLDEAAVPPAQLRERIERLHASGAPRPAAAGSACQRHHRDPARRQGFHADSAIPLREAAHRIANVAGRRVLDQAAGRQTVLRKADPARPQVRLDLLVLDAVEPISIEQLPKAPGLAGAG